MKLKYRLQHAFKYRILAPQLDRLDTWEGSVINRPGVFSGGENSPVRFNIPRKGLRWKVTPLRCLDFWEG